MANLAPSVPQPLARRRSALRLIVSLALGALAIVLLAISANQHWWRFWLFAPQYPQGLNLLVSLHGFGGDVREIDTLNHYIGMAPLDTAARFERKIVGPAMIGLCVAIGLLLAIPRRVTAWMAAFLAAILPTVFVVDSMYWLHRFGHGLNPKAPLRIKPFMPNMFGEGTIGQFSTFARAEPGFWLAIGAVVLLVAAAIIRKPRRAPR